MTNRSATTRLSERGLDLYQTEAWVTEELLKRVHIDGTVFECCVGEGKMSSVLDLNLETLAQREVNLSSRRIGQVERKLFTNDIDVQHPADFHLDATDPVSWAQFPPADWVVTNPPFNVAPKILPLAHQHAKTGVAFLLRLSYLEPCKNRWQWLIANKPHGTLITPRINFKTVERIDAESGETKTSKTDNITTVWLVWYKQRGMNQWLDFIAPLEKPDRNGHRKGLLLF